jgi:phosphatidylglycerophosphatase C
VTRRIAFFDFDGTITSQDTLLEFIRYSKGKLLFYIGFLINSPWLLAFKLKLISNHHAKQRILRYFFGRANQVQFQQTCDGFAASLLPHLVRWKAIKEIKLHQDMGTEIVVVSASAENWIRKWSDSTGVQLIATRLEKKGNILTGKIDGRNCSGKEKVRRIREKYDLSTYDEIYVYGDSSGDKNMMALATICFYRPFH